MYDHPGSSPAEPQQPQTLLVDPEEPCTLRARSHLYVWVQCLDVCSNACDQATTSDGHKDGVKLGWVSDLQGWVGGVGA